MKPAGVAALLLVLLAAGGGWISCKRGEELQDELRATQAACDEKVAAAERSGEEQLAALQTDFARYRASLATDPRSEFAAFGQSVAQRPFLARLKMTWFAIFKLQDELKPGETLLGRREVEEQRVERQNTVSSAGFLLGRRSNFIFGLVQVPVDDRALLYPGDYFLTPPGKAEIEVPMAFNRYPEYALSFAGLQVEGEVLAGCGAGPTAILHAWRTEKFIALVIGCEAPLGGTDIPLLRYEGYERWTRLTEQEIAFPFMTPAGGVAMAWTVLDRKYGEAGLVRTGIGMPASLGVTFLPLSEGTQEPVLHSMIFQIDAATQVWQPFWAVRKQLASARESFDFDRVLDVRLTVIPEAAYDPALRAKMLPSYQSLINMNEEYAPPDFSLPLIKASAEG